ncbi:MAG: TCP-1/cpn60 chaperonin family protein [Nitrosopumilus sp.]
MPKVVNKKIYKFEDIREQIMQAVDTLVDPIKGTISPRGANVIFTDPGGVVHHANDGYTIAKSINVEDPIQDVIIDIVKEAAIKTNTEAGDGTSTTALLSQILIREGLRKVDDGWNKMLLQKAIQKSGEKILARLKTFKRDIKSDKDLEYIANIASNNDKKIAKDVVKVVKEVGLRGLVYIEGHAKPTTEIKTDSGFIIKAGMFNTELRVDQSYNVRYLNAPVFITDKRLYHHEEAAAIIKAVIDGGFNSLVVVAQDFIGEAVNTFIANHTKGIMNILLVKEPHAGAGNDHLDDLAVYLGGTVVSDKKGMIVDKITLDNFTYAEKVLSDARKTVFTPQRKAQASGELSMKVSELQKLLSDDPDNTELEERIASLTTGMVTIKVGGATPIEVNERIYRYEDAVHAARSANEHGYLVGGGLALLASYNPKDHEEEIAPMFKKFCQATVAQIAENCGEYSKEVLKNSIGDVGYNAVTGKYEDLV